MNDPTLSYPFYFNYNITMIKLLTNRLNLFFLSTASNSKVINGKVVADLPWINFPTKPKPEED